MFVYLDTNFFIKFVEGNPEPLLNVFENGAAGVWDLVTSELTLAEVLALPIRENRSDLVSAYEEILNDEYLISLVPISKDILRESARLRSSLGNKSPDSIHVATAIESRCRIFISSDHKLRLPQQIHKATLEDLEFGDYLP